MLTSTQPAQPRSRESCQERDQTFFRQLLPLHSDSCNLSNTDMELPCTTDDQVAQFQAEYQAAFNAGSQDELEAAKCRFIWALVHSSTRTNQQRGLDLAQAALDNDQRSQDQDRELRYFLAVAQVKLGRYLDARRTLTSLMQDYPDFRQAEALKVDVDDRVVKDGLLGLGVVGAVAAVALGIFLGAGRKK